MKNVLLILLAAIGLVLAVFYYLQFDNTKQELQLANQRILDRDTQIYKLQKELGIFRNAPGKKQGPKAGADFAALSAADLSHLKSRGLKDPEASLKADLLKKQQQLLPAKGTLGGTMAIRDIRILNSRHVLAYFEDGHNAGQMVLRYEVKPGGHITWKVLDSFVL